MLNKTRFSFLKTTFEWSIMLSYFQKLRQNEISSVYIILSSLVLNTILIYMSELTNYTECFLEHLFWREFWTLLWTCLFVLQNFFHVFSKCFFDIIQFDVKGEGGVVCINCEFLLMTYNYSCWKHVLLNCNNFSIIKGGGRE